MVSEMPSDKEYIKELEDERNGWKRSAIELRAEVTRLRAELMTGQHELALAYDALCGGSREHEQL